jgi:hypothetical protein
METKVEQRDLRSALMKICGEAKKINHPFAASPQKLPLPGRHLWSS